MISLAADVCVYEPLCLFVCAHASMCYIDAWED